MRLVFGPDDEEGFLAAQTSLLDRFERWLAEDARVSGGEPDAAGDAGLALSWKWSYSDGDLGRWRTGDVGEFLLEWCPRKLSVSQSDCGSIPGSLAAFTAFLDDQALLAPGSSSVEAITAATVSMTDQFVAAMGDPANFGMAKSLFGAATADGIDLSDPERMQEWIAEFNARPDDDRRRIIPDSALGKPKRPALPPVVPPDDAEVAVSKAEAPILALFEAFAGYVGDGRKLTQTGKLTLADARGLVDLLKTGDVMDEKIGDRTFRTTSSAELPRLRLVFAWARKAGVVRVAHGRVIATKRGVDIARNPAGFFDRAVDALMAMGPLTSQRDSRTPVMVSHRRRSARSGWSEAGDNFPRASGPLEDDRRAVTSTSMTELSRVQPTAPHQSCRCVRRTGFRWLVRMARGQRAVGPIPGLLSW